MALPGRYLCFRSEAQDRQILAITEVRASRALLLDIEVSEVKLLGHRTWNSHEDERRDATAQVDLAAAVRTNRCETDSSEVPARLGVFRYGDDDVDHLPIALLGS